MVLMRESKIQNYRPTFRCPLYPWVQLAGTVGYCFLVAEMGRTPLLVSAAFLAAALGWYWLYARRAVAREPALVHVVERIAGRDLARYIVSKGSIAVDGVSLTIGPDPSGGRFRVFIIPHTWETTTLGRLSPGSRVNIEVDIMAKYAEKFNGSSRA